jgi:GT2 family glycosyltransferase
MSARDITLSVVSHRQNALVNALLRDLEACCAARVRVLVTENVADPEPLAPDGLSYPLERISNDAVGGFGANHNSAFRRCTTPYFCVCNPDVRLPADPFAFLLDSLATEGCGVCGPLVRDSSGALQDSARRFPTLASLLRKAVRPTGGPDYPVDQGPRAVDWVAGMFMLFRSDAYRAVGGFDESYFLYYEDIDICRRLGRQGTRTLYDPRAAIVHDARRASRRNVALARHHAASMLRFLLRG